MELIYGPESCYSAGKMQAKMVGYAAIYFQRLWLLLLTPVQRPIVSAKQENSTM